MRWAWSLFLVPLCSLACAVFIALSANRSNDWPAAIMYILVELLLALFGLGLVFQALRT